MSVEPLPATGSITTICFEDLSGSLFAKNKGYIVRKSILFCLLDHIVKLLECAKHDHASRLIPLFFQLFHGAFRFFLHKLVAEVEELHDAKVFVGIEKLRVSFVALSVFVISSHIPFRA